MGAGVVESASENVEGYPAIIAFGRRDGRRKGLRENGGCLVVVVAMVGSGFGNGGGGGDTERGRGGGRGGGK